MSKSNPASIPAADLRFVDRVNKEIELCNLLARQDEILRALDKERRPPREETKEQTEYFDTVGDAVVTVSKDQLRRRFPDDPDPVHEQTVFALVNERDRLHSQIERLKGEGVRVIGAQDAAALEAARGGRGAADTDLDGEPEYQAFLIADTRKIPRKALSNAIRLPTTDPNYLAHRREGRKVFIRESVAKKWTANYEARTRCKEAGPLGNTRQIKALWNYLSETTKNKAKE
jgi:hypothetical protein